jgi:choline kinase
MKRECDKAVILAAGGGTRVRSLTSGKPKCLMDLGGRPIIEWILRALAVSGITQAVVVTGFKSRILRSAVGDGSRHNLKIRYAHNPRWQEPNGLSLYAARRMWDSGERFLTLMSDHLLPPGVIRKVATAGTENCVLAVDTNIEGVFDISDATKVRHTGGVPEAIGKRLRSYNAVDCGLFRFDGRIFPAFETAFAQGKKSLTDGVRVLIKDGYLDVLPVGKQMFWIDIDTPRAYRQAVRRMDRFISTFSKKGKRQ